MSLHELKTNELLDLVASGREDAGEVLLGRHQEQLERTLRDRIDPRLRARIDCADIVQDALLHASKRLVRYALERPIEFYPWLLRIASNVLIDHYRTHVSALRRSVTKETGQPRENSPIGQPFDDLADSATSPSGALQRSERADEVAATLGRMSASDAEILELRFLRHLSISDIALELCIKDGAAKTRLSRAMRRFKGLWDGSNHGY